ncbi:hypothetical protein KCU64_g104, partial [Aureobasidium melanogenum]
LNHRWNHECFEVCVESKQCFCGCSALEFYTHSYKYVFFGDAAPMTNVCFVLFASCEVSSIYTPTKAPVTKTGFCRRRIQSHLETQKWNRRMLGLEAVLQELDVSPPRCST